MLLNRRRLRVCLDWHCYRADRSQINVQQYNQWLDQFNFKQFAACGIGFNSIISNMGKSHYPVLFIISLVL